MKITYQQWYLITMIAIFMFIKVADMYDRQSADIIVTILVAALTITGHIDKRIKP